MTELIYTDKSRFIPGVPARDLTADEVKLYGSQLVAQMPIENEEGKEVKFPSPAQALVETGLYARPKKIDSKDGK